MLGTLEASTPCPGSLLATGMGRRTEEGAGFCCLSLQGIGASTGAQRPASPCPCLAHSSSRLGVLGQGPQKGLAAFQASKLKAASEEGALAVPASLWLHRQSRAARSLDFLESLCCRAGAELAPCCGTWGWVQAPPKPGLSAVAAARGWPWTLLSSGAGAGSRPVHTCAEGAGSCTHCTGARQESMSAGAHGAQEMLRASTLSWSAFPRSPLQQAKGARRGAVLHFKPSLGRNGEWAAARGPHSDVHMASPVP